MKNNITNITVLDTVQTSSVKSMIGGSEMPIAYTKKFNITMLTNNITKRVYTTKANSVKMKANPVSALNPVVTSENADLLKESIIKNNKGKSGIYRWVNLINGKSYW
jgi:hypothetical protein